MSKAARPDFAVITNIGYSHIENLGSRENILKAKLEAADYLNPGGTLVLNGSDEMLAAYNAKVRTVTFGSDESCDIYPAKIIQNSLDGLSFTADNKNRISGERLDINVTPPGSHMVLNCLAAAAVGFLFGLTAREIEAGIAGFSTSGMRMETTVYNGITVINDTYNASPASVKAAIDVLSEVKGRRVCVLGDMLELGHFAGDLHFDAGEYAGERGIDLIITAGKESRHTYDGAVKAAGKGKAAYYEDKRALLDDIANLIQPGDTVLVKASRGMGFEDVAEKLKGLYYAKENYYRSEC